MTPQTFPISRISVWPIVQRLESLAGQFELFADQQPEDVPLEIAVLLLHCQIRLATLADFIAAVDRRQFVEDELNTLNDYLGTVQICKRLKTTNRPARSGRRWIPLRTLFPSPRRLGRSPGALPPYRRRPRLLERSDGERAAPMPSIDFNI